MPQDAIPPLKAGPSAAYAPTDPAEEPLFRVLGRERGVSDGERDLPARAARNGDRALLFDGHGDRRAPGFMALRRAHRRGRTDCRGRATRPRGPAAAHTLR